MSATHWNPPTRDRVMVTTQRLNKGQLIQPTRGKLFEVVEKALPFVYIIRRRSWRAE